LLRAKARLLAQSIGEDNRAFFTRALHMSRRADSPKACEIRTQV